MKKIKHIKIFAIALLLFPVAVWLQQFLELPELMELKGAFEKENKPELNWNNWFDGSFQTQFERYNNQNFGYRSTLVRVNNQIRYTLFNEVPSTQVLEYGDKNLVIIEYLNSYNGKDFIGTSTVNKRIKPLAFLAQELAKRNKLLFVVLAPDKASYYRETFGLPPLNKIDSTNYKVWKKALKEENVPFIDLRSQFLEMRDTTQAPLFSKSGIHWSIYGMNYAVDSISGFIDQKTNWQMPRMEIKDVKYSTTNIEIEHDLEHILNLLVPFKGEELGYQEFDLSPQVDSLPKMLVLSDSFFWQTFNTIASGFMEDPLFWYYNFEAYQYSTPGMDRNPSSYPLDSLIDEVDVFWLMSTTINLEKFPWGFDERISKELMDTNSVK